MGKKAGHKSTKKFAQSGQLKKTIQARHKNKVVQQRKAKKRARQTNGHSNSASGKGEAEEGDDDDADDNMEEQAPRKKEAKAGSKKEVDDFLGGGFLENDDEEDGEIDGLDDDEDEEDGEDGADDSLDDDASFASLDELDEGEAHKIELSKLAEKDPEFYKYLQDNDQELLEFDPSGQHDDDDMEYEDEFEKLKQRPVLTKEELKQWQKAIIETRSIKALRKLLIAFRSAVHMNEESERVTYTIDNNSLYNKVINTTLRYTPVVLHHHIPFKSLPNGKYKPPSQSTKQKMISKAILSYIYNVLHLLSQTSAADIQVLALNETAKLLPYIVGSRKAVKTYLKTCLELWSTASDEVRIAAFLAVRRVAAASDESLLDLALKSTYMTLVRSCKATSPHTLPSITLMKNLATELFCMDHAASYQHAFGYIRQLAVHLRTSLKVKTKEAYKQVYNWQYAHSVDFWSLLLARACDTEEERKTGRESELKPLIYPLVQVSLGAIKLISNARCFPFHFQILRSILHITQRTRTFVPLSAYFIPIIQSVLSPTSKTKPSTLRPVDLEVNIRAPAQYLKTRIYSETLADEAVFILAEWLGSRHVQGSIAFPEIVVPLVTVLRKCIKNSKGGKEAGLVKSLIEHVEDGAKWVEESRKNVVFSPGQMEEVEQWEQSLKIASSPMEKWLKVLRKQRAKRKEMAEKARQGEDEILSD
ncbi:Noc2-domain-containing protein [Sistotremastrum suecicum HHB10207 ss-3]|uniref:Noc2-domain-containing protein n=1 Tax=Sistotremastrum suecicum HHB10207 ss-3 TaxID=1314776 RepID=A0A166C7M5_9AGAM|nr:Noc2-domain-containing protein [Sistotremastrum suecicum HHB10207 ss-3]